MDLDDSTSIVTWIVFNPPYHVLRHTLPLVIRLVVPSSFSTKRVMALQTCFKKKAMTNRPLILCIFNILGIHIKEGIKKRIS